MLTTATESRQRTSLAPYWRSLAACLVFLAAYIAVIKGLHTETAQRSSAPPWFSWLRIPLARGPAQALFLMPPVIVFAGWMEFVRRASPFSPSPGLPLHASAGSGEGSLLFPIAAFLAVLLMNITVAMTDGSPSAIWKPFDRPGAEYYYDVPAVKSVALFLRDYVQHPLAYTLHTRTHPPGGVLLLYFIAHVLGPGIATAAWSAVVITASAVIPFYLLARRLADEQIARLATALYVVTPSLVLFGATSMDGVFLVPLMWSIYFLERTIDESGFVSAIAAGISLTISLMFSYVTVCVGVMMLIYAALKLSATPKLLRRAILSLTLCAAVIVALLTSLYRVTGFNYLAALHVSRLYDHYSMQTFSLTFGRYLDISISNLIAFLIGVSLPAVVLWFRQTCENITPRTDADRFNLALVVSVVFFSFARLFTHETERIWLFFIPPALIACATWIARQKDSQGKLLDWSMSLAFAQTCLFQLFLYTIW